MPLGDFSINCFGFLSDFWRKSQKGAKRKTGQKQAPSPQRGLPSRGEAEGPKRFPSATL